MPDELIPPPKPPSTLGYTLIQTTMICVMLACMFHWHHVQNWLLRHVGGSWELWRAVGFMLPALAQSLLVIGLNRLDIAIWRHNYGRQAQALDAALKFKAWVHAFLDGKGVPADPEPEENKKHGCRISGRMHWVFNNLKTTGHGQIQTKV
jgi:hypothetical protein